MAQPDPPATATVVVPTDVVIRAVAHLDAIERYLAGIYGILQQQEGAASMIGDLAPMLMSALMPGGPATTKTIEGAPVG